MLSSTGLSLRRLSVPLVQSGLLSTVRAVTNGAQQRSYVTLQPVGHFLHDRPKELPLDVGDFFVHSKLGCRAVVLRVDQERQDDGWWCRDVAHKTSKPFYVALVDSRDTKRPGQYIYYVSHCHAMPYKSLAPLVNPWDYVFLKGFVDGRHIIKPGSLNLHAAAL
eukprot:comp19307_c0_seq1/m.22171 comp19307_c0_seq1/g.22171  ORF comp19307_c0_seq1/g.22171 comp19307_c0_seq1/m.22171 type:complete len:164 (-) comp19307_c0_seq1:676-1167(-)